MSHAFLCKLFGKGFGIGKYCLMPIIQGCKVRNSVYTSMHADQAIKYKIFKLTIVCLWFSVKTVSIGGDGMDQEDGRVSLPRKCIFMTCMTL